MRKIALIMLASALMMFSCTKEGPRGPQGVPGPQGRDGSAATLYYLDIPVNQFKKEAYYDDNTQDYNDAWLAYGYIEGVSIQENDLVMVFMHQTTDGGPDNYFQALPYTDYFDNSTDFNHYSYGIMDNTRDLVFSIRRNDGTSPFNDMNADWTIQYNIYIVKGSANRKPNIPAYINQNNEKDIKSYLGIKEGYKAVSL